MNAPVTASPTPVLTTTNRTARRLVLMLMMVASVGYLCRVDITVVAPHLMAELHLSQPEMGRVFGAFLLGYTLFQIPSGWLAGRLPTRALFLALAFGWSALTFTSALVGRLYWGVALGALPALLFLRFVLGIVAAPTYPAAGRAISLSVPPLMQGRANGLVLGSIGIGSAVAPPLLGFMTVRWGWRPALLGAAVLAGFAAVAWRLIVPSQQTLMAARPQPVRPVGRAHASLLRRRSFWFLTASYTLQGYVGYVFVFWFFLYLVQVRKFELLQAAWLTSLDTESDGDPAGGNRLRFGCQALGLDVGPQKRARAGYGVGGRLSPAWGARPQRDTGRRQPDHFHGARPPYGRPILGLDDSNLRPAQRNRRRGYELWV
jgi:MFS transporter, ACS family, glucarate transporter